MDQANLAERFTRLADDWETSTRMLSSVHQICMNRSYQQIVGMGPAAVPLILERMARRPGHWFWALEAITGDDPVREEHRGNVAAMTHDWLAWGEHQQVRTA